MHWQVQKFGTDAVWEKEVPRRIMSVRALGGKPLKLKNSQNIQAIFKIYALLVHEEQVALLSQRGRFILKFY